MNIEVWLAPLGVAFSGVGAAWLTVRQVHRAAAAAALLEGRRIDEAAYERAKELYESGIAQLERQVSRLRELLHAERATTTRLLDQVFELRVACNRLETGQTTTTTTTVKPAEEGAE